MSDRYVTLNGFRYRLIRQLGVPGLIARADLAEVDYFGQRVEVVLKSLAVSESPNLKSRLESEAAVLKRLNESEVPGWGALRDAGVRCQKAADTLEQRVIIANFDAGLADDGHYYLVQELAPADIVEPFAIEDTADELKALRLAHRLTQAVNVVHAAGLALKDFLPQDKIDRLRVVWSTDNQTIDHIKVIDWNITGDTSDQPNDIVFLGSLIFALLTGQYVPLNQVGDRWNYAAFRPAELAPEAWTGLSTGTRLFVERLITPLPTQRLSQVRSILEELQWLIELLQQTEVPPTRWNEMIEAHRQNPERVLAIVAAAQACTHNFQDLPPRVQTDLTTIAQQAQQKMMTGQQRLLRDVRSDLVDQIYSGALERLAEVLPTLDPTSEIARQANYLNQQAYLGQTLNQQDIGTAADHHLTRDLIQKLIDKEWVGAHDIWQNLSDAARQTEPVLALNAVLEWRLAAKSIEHAIEDERVPAEARTEDVQSEEARLEALNRIQAKLATWYSLAPFEFDLNSQLSLLACEIDRRQRVLIGLHQARQFLDSGSDNQAEQLCLKLQRWSKGDTRLVHLHREIEATRHLRTALQPIQMALRAGHLARAQQLIEQISQQRPDFVSEPTWQRICERVGLPAMRQQSTARPKAPSRSVISQKKKETSQLRIRLNGLPKSIGLGVTADERAIHQASRELTDWSIASRQIHESGQGKLSARQLQDVIEVEGDAEDIRQKLIKRHLKDVTTALAKAPQPDMAALTALINQLREWGPDSTALRQLDQAAKKLHPQLALVANKNLGTKSTPDTATVSANPGLANIPDKETTGNTAIAIRQNLSRGLQQVSTHLSQGEYKQAAELARSLRTRPAELKEVQDAEWAAATHELDLEATIKTTQDLIEQFQTTSKDLTQYTIALAEINLDALPRTNLECSGAEQRCLELIENSAHWAVAARQAHEQKRLLIFDLLDQVKRLEEHGYTLRQQLIERRFGDIDSALDAFGQNDLPISAFLEKLRGCQPVADLARQLDARAKRLADLRTLREGTQRGLDDNDLVETVKAFEQVAASPAVSLAQRADIRRLLMLWHSFRNAPGEPPTMPEFWETSAPWPGSDTLLTRMRDQVGQYLLGLADQQQRAGNPESASEYYRKAERYCKFTETQLTQQREVERQIKRLRQEQADWETVREQVEENLIHLTNSSVEIQPIAQAAWDLLKSYNTPAADRYRARLRVEVEKRVWSQLSLDATVDDLERVSRQLNDIRLITLEARWGTWAMIVNGLCEVLLGQSNWATFECYFNQAKRERGWFDTLARQIADNGQPERLQALLTHYHHAWEQAFERCWQEAYTEAKAAVQAERSGAAAGWVEKARTLKKNTGLDLPSATERDMDAIGVQAEMLQRRERAIAAASPAQPITVEQLTALQTLQKEVGADQLPSHTAYVTFVERVQALRLKQVALAWPTDESRYAERLMALKTAQGEGGKPIGETTAYWSARLKAYDQQLAQLNTQIKDKLQRTQHELKDLTESAVKDAAASIRSGKPSIMLVQRAANLIWQISWLVEISAENQPITGHRSNALAKTLAAAIAEARNQFILNCHDRAAYEQAKQTFIELEHAERQLKTRPDGVPLPDRHKSDSVDLNFFNLPADWQPATLDQFTLPGLLWTALNDLWRQLGQPLKFDSAATAAIELVERVTAFDVVLKGLPSNDQALPKARAALDQAQHIAAAAHKAQLLAATDPISALIATKDFPKEPAEPLRDADWLWADPRWLDRQIEQARHSIEAAILPKVQAQLKKVSTAAENLRRDVLPLMHTSERGTVELALLEGAREASADHLKNRRQSDALKVWSIIETLGKETNSVRLKKEGRTRFNQLSGRKRLLMALGGVAVVALGSVLFVLLLSQGAVQQTQLAAAQTAEAIQAQSAATVAANQAQLVAIQTATAGCKQLDFEVLTSPGSQTVADDHITLTWRVRNTSTTAACNWDQPNWQLLASGNLRKDPYLVALTKVPGQTHEYDLSITADLPPGQNRLLEWHLTKPGEIGVEQGPTLQAEVMVATPTYTPTPTETLTPTPTRTPLPKCPTGQTRVGGVGLCVAWTPIPVPDTPTPASNCHEESYQCNCQQVSDPVTGEKQKVCETCTRTVCQ